MKILGIGVDVVNNRRIQLLIKNQTFIKRTFGPNELKFSKNKINRKNFFAKRFAAKEAFSKALGTGVAKGINFKEIIILNEKNGKPYIKLIDETKKAVDNKLKIKNYKISLSLSDEDKYAVAFVTILI